MIKLHSYCDTSVNDSLNKKYHDKEYGFPLKNDHELFERLVLEISQAGLSWTTILKKRDNIRRAFDNFNISKITNYDEDDRTRLLNDKGIIRNRLKVNAVIKNASVISIISARYGSFASWLDLQGSLELEEWVLLFRKNLYFTGPKIVGEFLLSTGYLAGAHDKSCPVYNKIKALNPPWMRGE